MRPASTLVRRLVRICGSLRHDERGFSTAELLANAALGIAALVVIWGLLQGLGEDVVIDVSRRLLGR